MIGDVSTAELARVYIRAGLAVVPIPTKTKAPRIPAWQDLRIVEGDVARYFPDESNIGVLLGAASGGAVDVDLDCLEAVALADEFLRPTLTFGRASRLRSHWEYVSRGAVSSRYEDVPDADGKRATLCELRAGAPKASQTVFPGSVHPSGERIEWSADDGRDAVELADALTVIDAGELQAAVACLAAATLVARVAGLDAARIFAERGVLPPLDDERAAKVRSWLGIVEPAPRKVQPTRRTSREDKIGQINAVGVLGVARALGLPIDERRRALKTCPACGMDRRSDGDGRAAAGIVTSRNEGVELWTHAKCGATGDAVALLSYAAVGKARPVSKSEWRTLWRAAEDAGVICGR